MTAAEDRREELEALLWKHAIPAPLVAEILTAADAYAKAFRRSEPRPPAPRKPPAVHYALEGRKHPACRPYALISAGHWEVSGDPRAVNCGHCVKTFGPREAAGS